MTTATAEVLSDAAREFVAGPHQLLIGGERVAAADGRTFATIDPATGEPICEVAQAGPEDVDRAVSAARGALEGPLRKVSPSKRAGLMYTLAELIKANGGELAELESLDNGKPLAAANGDIAASVAHLRYYAGWPTKIEGETIPVSGRDLFVYTLREPVGVCAQIVPWNFPLLMAVWKIAPALAAGCPLDPQARRADAADRAAARRAGARGGLSRGDAQRAHRRRRDRRRAGRPPGRRQGRVHRLDRGRPRDRRQVRPGAEAGDARARRQEPEHRPARRRPRRRGQGLLPGHLLQLRPGLQRGLAAVRAELESSTSGRAPRRVRLAGQGRPRARPRVRVRPADLRGAVRPRHRLHRLRALGGRRGGRRRHAGDGNGAATSSTRPCSPASPTR